MASGRSPFPSVDVRAVFDQQPYGLLSPAMDAIINGVRPSPALCFASAPAFSNRVTTAGAPLLAAMNNGE